MFEGTDFLGERKDLGGEEDRVGRFPMQSWVPMQPSLTLDGSRIIGALEQVVVRRPVNIALLAG